MDDSTDKKAALKKPGTPFFMLAMGFYLLLVHGSSLLTIQATRIQGPPLHYPDTWPWLSEALNRFAGTSALSCVLLALPLLYGCMVCVFLLTRQLVGGPPWLGSLAGTFLMAHPLKTEVLFTPTGVYYGLATLTALAATLGYLRLHMLGGGGRYATALLLFVCALFPFTINAALLGVLFLIEFLVGDPEKRNWLKLFPFLLVTMLANWFRLDTLYAEFPTGETMYAPLLLVLYPIGLLPETLVRFGASPWQAWAWGGLAFVCVVASLYFVKSKSYRFVLIAIVFFRIYPGALPIDYVTMDGGGQLFYPLALTGVALAALSAWLMGFEAWGKPTVALTTVLCVVLFVLQFQANRAYVQRMQEVGHPCPTQEACRSIKHAESCGEPSTPNTVSAHDMDKLSHRKHASGATGRPARVYPCGNIGSAENSFLIRRTSLPSTGKGYRALFVAPQAVCEYIRIRQAGYPSRRICNLCSGAFLSCWVTVGRESLRDKKSLAARSERDCADRGASCVGQGCPTSFLVAS